MTDVVLERALRAVGRTRVGGLHFYGHFVGVSGELPVDGEARLRLEGEPSGVGTSAVSPMAFATLADLAMSASIRSRLEAGLRLGTVTLSLQHPVESVVGPLAGEATATWVGESGGTARCTILAGGRPVGAALGWFAALPAPPGTVLTLTPWERVETPPVVVPSPDDLDDREAAVIDAAIAAGRRAAEGGTPVSQEILTFAWGQSAEGAASGSLRIGPELGNRVGHIQGGALYGAAASAASRALGVPGAALADGHYEFLRPADGATLSAEASVVRRGRSAAFVESRLLVDGTAVGIGLFAFRL